MLSGNLPRGSSSTPVSGKIGRMAASPAPPLRSLITPASGKHHGGQPSSTAQGQRIGRSHDFEELDELFARRLLVPFAIAFEQRQQLVDGGLSLAASEQRRRELEAGLVIVSVFRQSGSQFSRRRHC